MADILLPPGKDKLQQQVKSVQQFIQHVSHLRNAVSLDNWTDILPIMPPTLTQIPDTITRLTCFLADDIKSLKDPRKVTEFLQGQIRSERQRGKDQIYMETFNFNVRRAAAKHLLSITEPLTAVWTDDRLLAIRPHLDSILSALQKYQRLPDWEQCRSVKEHLQTFIQRSTWFQTRPAQATQTPVQSVNFESLTIWVLRYVRTKTEIDETQERCRAAFAEIEQWSKSLMIAQEAARNLPTEAETPSIYKPRIPPLVKALVDSAQTAVKQLAEMKSQTGITSLDPDTVHETIQKLLPLLLTTTSTVLNELNRIGFTTEYLRRRSLFETMGLTQSNPDPDFILSELGLGKSLIHLVVQGNQVNICFHSILNSSHETIANVMQTLEAKKKAENFKEVFLTASHELCATISDLERVPNDSIASAVHHLNSALNPVTQEYVLQKSLDCTRHLTDMIGRAQDVLTPFTNLTEQLSELSGTLAGNSNMLDLYKD
jgi:hypothetical protein